MMNYKTLNIFLEKLTNLNYNKNDYYIKYNNEK